MTAAQSFLDLGDEITVESVLSVQSIMMSSNGQGDLIGSLLVDGEGMCALAITPHEGDMRYFDFLTGNVTTARPDARVIVTQWTLSVGSEGHRQKIVQAVARPAER